MTNANVGVVPDLMKFSDDKFQVESVVHTTLTINTEEGVRQVYQKLNDAKEIAAMDLQRNVHKNYNEFLEEVNKGFTREEQFLLIEADKTPSPATTTTTSIISPVSIESVTKSSTLDKVFDLKRKEMSLLYDSVEGFKKALPPSSSRQILHQTNEANITEINLLSNKQKSVQIYVLSDAILVTSRKKNIIPGKVKLVVERCFKIEEIAMVDVKDTEYTNAFKVLKHPDVYIYKSEFFEDKRATLSALKRVTDEINALKRKEKEYILAAVSQTGSETSVPSPTHEIGQKTSNFGMVGSAQPKIVKDELLPQDVKWLSDLADELDVLIAHREFDLVTSYISKARRTLTASIGDSPRVLSFRKMVEERVMRVAGLIIKDLTNQFTTKSKVQKNISQLMCLGFGEQARDMFLSTRSSTIKHRIRHLKSDGDVTIYIDHLADMFFNALRNTCDWFSASFTESSMSSVFDSDQSFSVIDACLQATIRHGQQLRQVGLDMSFLLDSLFFEDVCNAMQQHSLRCEESIVASISADDFVEIESGAEFCKRTISFR
ncbi:exocyst complex component exo84 [Nowakowskiella sp. JEL0407]|nr:exocyst complex component exo84 [Nowakowskiella sp. JEL0407]